MKQQSGNRSISLLSTDKLTRYLQEYYRNTSVQTYERVNLYLANFQTSDSVINYLFMEDEEGNLFHSLNGSDSEIEDVLRNSTEYQKIKETGSSSISPIKKGETAAFPSYYAAISTVKNCTDIPLPSVFVMM